MALSNEIYLNCNLAANTQEGIEKKTGTGKLVKGRLNNEC